MTHPHPPSRPSSVVNAVGLFYISLVLGLLRALIDWPVMTRDSSSGFILLVLAFVFGSLLLLIHKVNQGRNWARITLLVLFVLGLPFGIGPLLHALGTASLSGMLGLLQMVFQMIGLGMLFTADARPWFDPAHRLDGDMKKCPYCAEPIRREAIKCRYCGSDLTQAA